MRPHYFASVLDACVTAPMPVADTLLRLAERDPPFYAPLWSHHILAEVKSTLLKSGDIETVWDGMPERTGFLASSVPSRSRLVYYRPRRASQAYQPLACRVGRTFVEVHPKARRTNQSLGFGPPLLCSVTGDLLTLLWVQLRG